MIEEIVMKSPYRRRLEMKQNKLLVLYEKYSNTDIQRSELWKLLVKKTDYTTVEGVLKALRANGIDIKKRTYNRKKETDESGTIEKRAESYRG